VDHSFFLLGQSRRLGVRMSPNLAVISDGKKFMWDGHLYATTEEASRLEKSYQNDNFETRMVAQEGKFLVYTRRVVKEVAVSQA
jgi:hypothetical protein